jgi:hypothetical protein
MGFDRLLTQPCLLERVLKAIQDRLVRQLSCIAWTRCSYVWAGSASVMQPLSSRSAVLLPLVSPSCQDEFAILKKGLNGKLYWSKRASI